MDKQTYIIAVVIGVIAAFLCAELPIVPPDEVSALTPIIGFISALLAAGIVHWVKKKRGAARDEL